MQPQQPVQYVVVVQDPNARPPPQQIQYIQQPQYQQPFQPIPQTLSQFRINSVISTNIKWKQILTNVTEI